MFKTKKRSSERMEALKLEFVDKCCHKKNPIPTEIIFELMGFDYKNPYDQQALYRYIRDWTIETIKENWKIKPQNNQEFAFTKFLEKIYLEKKPFGYCINSFFILPKTFEEWERIKRTNTLNQLHGYATCIGEMENYGMRVYGIPAENLLTNINRTIKLIEMSRDEENE